MRHPQIDIDGVGGLGNSLGVGGSATARSNTGAMGSSADGFGTRGTSGPPGSAGGAGKCIFTTY